MRVKELIELLSKQDPELRVIIHHTDHTDWDYNLPLRDKDIRVEEIWDIEEANFEGGEKPNEGEEYLVIDFNFE
jgi:hypothetical protein